MRFGRGLAVFCLILVLSPGAPAQTESREARGETPDSPLLKRLNSLRLLGRYEEGLALAEQALEADPGAARLHYAMGILHGLSNRHVEALRHFNLELEADPGHVESYRGRAMALGLLGRGPEALEALETARDLAPGDPGLLTDLGRAQNREGRHEDALRTLEGAIERGAGSEAAVELSRLLRQRGALPEAASLLQSALRDEPMNPEALFNLGQTLVALGDHQAGRALLNQHAELALLVDEIDVLERSSRLPGATALNFIRLADAQQRADRSEDAGKSYRRALQLDPNAIPALLGLSSLALRSGDTVAATPWAVHALLTAPDDWRGRFQLGLIRLHKGEHQLAGEAFAASQELEPWDAETYRRCADAYYDAALFGDARAHYLKALASEEDHDDARLGLALTELVLGNAQRAVALLEEAQLERPAGPILHAALGLGLQRVNSGARKSTQVLDQAAVAFRVARLTGRSTEDIWRRLAPIPGASDLRPLLDPPLARQNAHEPAVQP